MNTLPHVLILTTGVSQPVGLDLLPVPEVTLTFQPAWVSARLTDKVALRPYVEVEVADFGLVDETRLQLGVGLSLTWTIQR